MDITLKNELEELVNSIFSKKEDADKKEMLVEALNDAKAKLVEASAALTDKDAEIEELISKIEAAEKTMEDMTSECDSLKASEEEFIAVIKNKDEELAAKTEELEAVNATIVAGESLEYLPANTLAENEASAEKKDLEFLAIKEELEKVSAELEQIKKDAIVAERMSELEKAGLARSDEKGIAAQEAKVCDFSDEDYATYKEELEAIKESIVASFKTSAAKKEDVSADIEVINLEGDGEVTVKDIGEALSDLFYGKKEEK